ncbi:flagellar basal body-associated FliL family protein [Luteimonas sp. 3794]|uniref:flagellar basal body-associated FliL family protein n=1 Tax=Luteimonas sp. 3794 TaxID=2817730 RepID=UPI0028653526|nr:flagellar basal body-associated FliL family protein [Luteimonas sp. 3794]MDR6990854.1 flagellar FliL protein [Luteimonas sp. 3794]
MTAVSPASPAPSKKRRLLMITIGLLVLAGAGAGGWYMFMHKAAAPAEEAKTALPAPAQYLPMTPAFVVNLDETPSGPRYLQVEVQLVTRDPLAGAALQAHEPALRARLLMLFAQQTYDGVSTRAGKEALQAQALKEVQALMTEETGKPVAEALLFTSFVTQ